MTACARCFASATDAELVGEAATGEDAITLASSLQPDVVLMDLQMPGLNGIEANRRIVQESPHVRVLVMIMFEDDSSVLAAMRAGARGYLPKGATHAEMARAIRAVGCSYLLCQAAEASGAGIRYRTP